MAGKTYDHIVRNAEEFEHYRKYIAENPVRAELRSGFKLGVHGWTKNKYAQE